MEKEELLKEIRETLMHDPYESPIKEIVRDILAREEQIKVCEDFMGKIRKHIDYLKSRNIGVNYEKKENNI